MQTKGIELQDNSHALNQVLPSFVCACSNVTTNTLERWTFFHMIRVMTYICSMAWTYVSTTGVYVSISDGVGAIYAIHSTVMEMPHASHCDTGLQTQDTFHGKNLGLLHLLA